MEQPYVLDNENANLEYGWQDAAHANSFTGPKPYYSSFTEGMRPSWATENTPYWVTQGPDFITLKIDGFEEENPCE